MRATLMYGAGDVRVEDVPDAHLIEPTDALVRVTRAAICGSDLWPTTRWNTQTPAGGWGTSSWGIVDAVGTDVRSLNVGDLVVSLFLWSDGTCVFCREGLHSECLHGGRYGSDNDDDGQGEAGGHGTSPCLRPRRHARRVVRPRRQGQGVGSLRRRHGCHRRRLTRRAVAAAAARPRARSRSSLLPRRRTASSCRAPRSWRSASSASASSDRPDPRT